MDDDVCLECGGNTRPMSSALPLPSGPVTRTWSECPGCGWESLYKDSSG